MNQYPCLVQHVSAAEGIATLLMKVRADKVGAHKRCWHMSEATTRIGWPVALGGQIIPSRLWIGMSFPSVHTFAESS
jgi:hypothetical protein